jgi:hypothetical protein
VPPGAAVREFPRASGPKCSSEAGGAASPIVILTWSRETGTNQIILVSLNSVQLFMIY